MVNKLTGENNWGSIPAPKAPSVSRQPQKNKENQIGKLFSGHLHITKSSVTHRSTLIQKIVSIFKRIFGFPSTLDHQSYALEKTNLARLRAQTSNIKGALNQIKKTITDKRSEWHATLPNRDKAIVHIREQDQIELKTNKQLITLDFNIKKLNELKNISCNSEFESEKIEAMNKFLNDSIQDISDDIKQCSAKIASSAKNKNLDNTDSKLSDLKETKQLLLETNNYLKDLKEELKKTGAFDETYIDIKIKDSEDKKYFLLKHLNTYKDSKKPYESLKEIHNLRLEYSKIRNDIILLNKNLKEISKYHQHESKKNELANLKKEILELNEIKKSIGADIRNIVKSDIQRGSSIFHKLFIPTGHTVNPEAHYSNEELFKEKTINKNLEFSSYIELQSKDKEGIVTIETKKIAEEKIENTVTYEQKKKAETSNPFSQKSSNLKTENLYYKHLDRIQNLAPEIKYNPRECVELAVTILDDKKLQKELLILTSLQNFIKNQASNEPDSSILDKYIEQNKTELKQINSIMSLIGLIREEEQKIKDTPLRVLIKNMYDTINETLNIYTKPISLYDLNNMYAAAEAAHDDMNMKLIKERMSSAIYDIKQHANKDAAIDSDKELIKNLIFSAIEELEQTNQTDPISFVEKVKRKVNDELEEKIDTSLKQAQFTNATFERMKDITDELKKEIGSIIQKKCMENNPSMISIKTLTEIKNKYLKKLPYSNEDEVMLYESVINMFVNNANKNWNHLQKNANRDIYTIKEDDINYKMNTGFDFVKATEMDVRVNFPEMSRAYCKEMLDIWSSITVKCNKLVIE
jgi:hypothetical protein